MLKKVYFIVLLLSSITASAMEQDSDSSPASAPRIILDHNASESEGTEIQENADDLDDSVDEQNDSDEFSPNLLNPCHVFMEGGRILVNFAYQNPELVQSIVALAMPVLVGGTNCSACMRCECVCYGKGFVGHAADILTCMTVCKNMSAQFVGCYISKGL